MYKISFYILGALIVSGCYAQKTECDISFKVYDDFFRGKYKIVFFADSYRKFEVGSFMDFNFKYGD